MYWERERKKKNPSGSCSSINTELTIGSFAVQKHFTALLLHKQSRLSVLSTYHKSDLANVSHHYRIDRLLFAPFTKCNNESSSRTLTDDAYTGM